MHIARVNAAAAGRERATGAAAAATGAAQLACRREGKKLECNADEKNVERSTCVRQAVTSTTVKAAAARRVGIAFLRPPLVLVNAGARSSVENSYTVSKVEKAGPPPTPDTSKARERVAPGTDALQRVGALRAWLRDARVYC